MCRRLLCVLLFLKLFILFVDLKPFQSLIHSNGYFGPKLNWRFGGWTPMRDDERQEANYHYNNNNNQQQQQQQQLSPGRLSSSPIASYEMIGGRVINSNYGKKEEEEEEEEELEPIYIENGINTVYSSNPIQLLKQQQQHKRGFYSKYQSSKTPTSSSLSSSHVSHVNIPVAVETEYDKILTEDDLQEIQQHVLHIIPQVEHIITTTTTTRTTPKREEEEEKNELNAKLYSNQHYFSFYENLAKDKQEAHNEEEERKEEEEEEDDENDERKEENEENVIHLIANQKNIPKVLNVRNLLKEEEKEKEKFYGDESMIELVDGAGSPNFNKTHHPLSFHAFYAPTRQAAPPGYTKLSLSEFQEMFKDAQFHYLEKKNESQSFKQEIKSPLLYL